MKQNHQVIDLYDPLGALAYAFCHLGFQVSKILDSTDEKELSLFTRNNIAQLCPEQELLNFFETSSCTPDILTSQICWVSPFNAEYGQPPQGNLDNIIAVVQKLHPAYLVLESRTNFRTSRMFEKFLNLLLEENYKVSWRILDPMEHAGIPLKEKRLYIIAGFENMETDFLFPGKISPVKSPFDFLEQTDAYSHSEKIIRSCKEPGIYNWSNGTLHLSDTVNNTFYRPVVNDGHGARYISPLEIARLKGFPDDYFPKSSSGSWLYQQLRWSANVHISRMIAGSIQKLLPETFGLPADTNAQEDAVAAESTDTMEENLERRYDVFVSSTYEDLKEERKEITQAILECDCIPVGMEMFPASNTEQWKFIQKVIDRADFYLVVIAGKYGSVMEDTGKSYTEMEFDYAMEKGKPILVFQYENINDLARSKTEIDPQKVKALEHFREKSRSNRLIRFYSDKNELKAAVLSSLHNLKKQLNSGGWIRAEDAKKSLQAADSINLHAENSRLKQENDNLKKENAALSAKIRETKNSLEQINETFSALEKQVSQSLHSLKI